MSDVSAQVAPLFPLLEQPFVRSEPSLRRSMVGGLLINGAIRSDAVEAAMRAVKRRVFAPEAALGDVYCLYAPVGSMVAPQIQAMMLEQAQIRPGMRVVECGSGGYAAALARELVGPDGEVVTIVPNPYAVHQVNRRFLDAGYDDIRVVSVGSDRDLPAVAPDRVLVTRPTWDVLPEWWTQLGDGGRLVVLLRLQGLTCSLALDRQGNHLVSDSVRISALTPRRDGPGHHEIVLAQGPDTIGPHPRVPLAYEDSTGQGRAWTNVFVQAREPDSDEALRLYLATMLPGPCNAGAKVGASMAYLVTRYTPQDQIEYGVHVLGPNEAAVAELVAGHVRDWDRLYRGGLGPRVAVFPADTPDGDLPAGRRIDKLRNVIVVSWPRQ